MRSALAASLCLLFLSACSGEGDDDPTQIRDLRVLGVASEAPELMSPTCDLTSPQTLLTFAQSVTFKALMVDPQGEGRPISWELWGCASAADRTCAKESDRVLVASGNTAPGEMQFDFQPGLLTLPNQDNRPLLDAVRAEDPVQGLGGLRMPLVLHLQAGTEEVFAQKLMVFSCAQFPESKANLTPVLPGLTLNDQPWDAVPSVNGSDPETKITPLDFTGLEETYVVSSLELQPVQLTESWKISWITSLGRMDQAETGGTDLGGSTARQNVKWIAPSGLTDPANVTIWAVVRDGRGGTSWLAKEFTFHPEL